MGDKNPICTLGDYSKPSQEGYRNTIELHVGNNVDFLKLVDSLDLNGKNRERMRLRLFQFSLRGQASNWLERLPVGSITIWEDLTTHFLAQFFPPGTPDFAKPIKAIALPQDVPSTYDRRLIKLENQVQYLMEAHRAATQPTQVNKDTTSCEICSGPYDTQYCMEDPEQVFVEYASSRIDEAGDMPLLERKDITAIGNLRSNKDDGGIEWLDVKEPLDLVDTSEESVYESLIKEMPKCSLNYDFSEDDYDRGCRKPSHSEDRFYRDTIKLGPEYATRMDDEGEVTKFLIKNEEEFFIVPGDGVGKKHDGVASPAMLKFKNL
ncbi:MAK10-like protein [Tanacetum coccineum]